MLVEITNYYAREGRAADVLAQRRHATAIRRELGLPPGRIFVRMEGNGPDVRWECAFADQAAFAHDLAVRAGSEAFAAARKSMHALLERFERHVEEQVAD